MLLWLIRNLLDPFLAGPDPSAPGLHEVRDLIIPGPSPIPARLYRPAADADVLLVFFHGGGLVSSSLATHDAACRHLAAGAGFNILSIGYRLAPEHPYPAAHDDAETALRWAGAASDLGFALNRLLAGGDSAGGLLAGAAALRLAAGGERSVDGLALFYPLLSLTPVADDPPMFRRSRAALRRWVGGAVAGEADMNLLTADPAHLPPVLLVNGGRDPTRLDAMRLATRLEAAGRAVTVLTEPLATHGFLNMTAVSRRSREQAGRVARALAATFAP